MHPVESAKSRKLPESATHTLVNSVGALCFLLGVYLIPKAGILSPTACAIALLFCMALPIIALELAFYRSYENPSTGLDFSLSRPLSWKRVFVKVWGLAGTLSCIALIYWAFPEYHRPFYAPFGDFLRVVLPWFLALSIPYLAFVDSFMKKPQDGTYYAGKFFLYQWEGLDRALLIQHFLGWLIKAYFLPIMYVYYFQNIFQIAKPTSVDILAGFGSIYEYSQAVLYAVDLVFITVGYILTLRVLDTHIRSAEPTFLGWAAAVICYEPFWGLLALRFFAYDLDGIQWNLWLAEYPMIMQMCGISIIGLTAIYVWASVAFGLRFSNLTNRGILTGGPYRWCKHPAYVAKNLSWWLIAMPFLTSAEIFDAFRATLALIGVNLVYYVRALTEERHLSSDPTYVQYALAMNSRSIFSPIAKIFPFVLYRAPEPMKIANVELQ